MQTLWLSVVNNFEVVCVSKGMGYWFWWCVVLLAAALAAKNITSLIQMMHVFLFKNEILNEIIANYQTGTYTIISCLCHNRNE